LPDTIKRRAGNDYAALVADYPDRTYLPLGEWQKFNVERDVAYRIRDQINAHPIAGAMLEGCSPEVVAIWTDKETGIKCKCRIDLLRNDFKRIVDLKTTAKFIPYQIVKVGYSYGYHIQVAMYVDALCTLKGLDFDEDPPEMYYIFVEKEPPYLIMLADGHASYDEMQELSDPYGYLRMGRLGYRQALHTILSCQSNDVWEGHPYDPQEMIIPKWAGWE